MLEGMVVRKFVDESELSIQKFVRNKQEIFGQFKGL